MTAAIPMNDAREDAVARFVLRADTVFMYFALFAASGALFRYGPVNTWLWYAVYGWMLARLALEPPAIFQAAIRNWPVFLWPGLALASVAWSLAPGSSLQGGMQLLMTTVIAVFIGVRFPVREIVAALAVVLSVAAIVSMLLLLTPAPGMFAVSGGYEGVFAHKNTLGLRMNILVSALLALLFETRSRAAQLIIFAMLAVAAYLLVMSKSATSQILALATPAVLFALAALRLNAGKAALAAAAGFACAAAGVATLFVMSGDPVSFVLDSFGKDSTLTGRTWLWERGVDEAMKHPLLGGGYQAFWVHDRSSEVMWIRHITLDTVKGFHNVGIEVWNDLGVPGLLALVGVLLVYARRAFRFYRASPAASALIPLFFLIIVAVSGSVNNAFFRQHELVHVLIGAFFAGCFALFVASEGARARHV